MQAGMGYLHYNTNNSLFESHMNWIFFYTFLLIKFQDVHRDVIRFKDLFRKLVDALNDNIMSAVFLDLG